MTSYSRVAAVTGGNKGIGLACVRQLALQYPLSRFNDGPLLIYLTARDEGRGRAAVDAMLQDPLLVKAKALRAHGGLVDVRYLSLDVDSDESIGGFAAVMKEKHPSGIDMFVNNAGIAVDGFDAEVVRRTLRCNYYGAVEVTRQMLPQIRDGGRFVHVASQAGMLSNKYADTMRDRFYASKTLDEVTGIMQDFQTAVSNGSWKSQWPTSAYSVSKAGMIGMTRTFAAQLTRAGSRTLMNVCCPGYVDTDMTKHRGIKTPDQGAQTPVYLALGDIGGVNGEFWVNEKVSSW